MVKRVLARLIIGFGVVVLLAGAVQAQPRMTREDLLPLLGTPGIYVIDVRAASDWDSSDLKIKGAIREDPANIDSWAAKYPKDTTIVLYCA